MLNISIRWATTDCKLQSGMSSESTHHHRWPYSAPRLKQCCWDQGPVVAFKIKTLKKGIPETFSLDSTALSRLLVPTVFLFAFERESSCACGKGENEEEEEEEEKWCLPVAIQSSNRSSPGCQSFKDWSRDDKKRENKEHQCDDHKQTCISSLFKTRTTQ